MRIERIIPQTSLTGNLFSYLNNYLANASLHHGISHGVHKSYVLTRNTIFVETREARVRENTESRKSREGEGGA